MEAASEHAQMGGKGPSWRFAWRAVKLQGKAEERVRTQENGIKQHVRILHGCFAGGAVQIKSRPDLGRLVDSEGLVSDGQ